MQIPAIRTSSLSVVVKIVGFIISWATSIYFLWVRNPPRVLTQNQFFPQVQRISIVMVSIFLALSWGYLANPRGLTVLAWVAGLATTFGVAAFFLTAAAISRDGAESQKKGSTALLVAFLAYTFTISAGLTSAGVFLTVILGNPANASTGTSLVSNDIYEATIGISGVTSSQHDQEVPFSVSSGQINFGCEQTQVAQARFTLPQGAQLLQSSATWKNVDNAKAPVAGSTQTGDIVIAQGTIRGLDLQSFGFVKNCPGGGHGEVVLSGIYRASITETQEKKDQIMSDVPAGAKDFVWVTLPTKAQMEIHEIDVEFRKKSAANIVDTVAITPDRADTLSANHLFRVTIVDGRLGMAPKN